MGGKLDPHGSDRRPMGSKSSQCLGQQCVPGRNGPNPALLLRRRCGWRAPDALGTIFCRNLALKHRLQTSPQMGEGRGERLAQNDGSRARRNPPTAEISVNLARKQASGGKLQYVV